MNSTTSRWIACRAASRWRSRSARSPAPPAAARRRRRNVSIPVDARQVQVEQDDVHPLRLLGQARAGPRRCGRRPRRTPTRRSPAATTRAAAARPPRSSPAGRASPAAAARADASPCRAARSKRARSVWASRRAASRLAKPVSPIVSACSNASAGSTSMVSHVIPRQRRRRRSCADLGSIRTSSLNTTSVGTAASFPATGAAADARRRYRSPRSTSVTTHKATSSRCFYAALDLDLECTAVGEHARASLRITVRSSRRRVQATRSFRVRGTVGVAGRRGGQAHGEPAAAAGAVAGGVDPAAVRRDDRVRDRQAQARPVLARAALSV